MGPRAAAGRALGARLWARRSSGVAFESMGLHPHTLRGLHEAFRFREATQVQAKVLPKLLAKDARGSTKRSYKLQKLSQVEVRSLDPMLGSGSLAR